MRFDVVTLFPEMFPGYLGQSLLNKAIERGLVNVNVHDLRDWSDNKHNRVDDRPYGGGPGMVIMVEPVVRCVESILSRNPGARTILLTPQGKRLNQRMVEEMAGSDSFVFLCGRYEGFDQRVVDLLKPEEISVGDYVLNGGEVASMVMIDSLIRMVPGVLGDENSSIQDSFSSGNRMLEFAQYTRPREFRGASVPEILLSGNHEEIRQWRHKETIKRTKERRSDLLNDEDVETG
ncbi:MAG: tRNA (guanosine(37)-N1)-methyltransferase TrmD [Planctomycetota bacterium]|nr:tRNA (guanosine(37)-N1)-methyltransferase TrmD [Planctomycetota bacterium]